VYKNMDIEKKEGIKLLKLYRIQRRLEVRTLNGHIVPNHNRKIHDIISNEIEILAKTVGARAKTRIRKKRIWNNNNLNLQDTE